MIWFDLDSGRLEFTGEVTSVGRTIRVNLDQGQSFVGQPFIEVPANHPKIRILWPPL